MATHKNSTPNIIKQFNTLYKLGIIKCLTKSNELESSAYKRTLDLLDSNCKVYVIFEGQIALLYGVFLYEDLQKKKHVVTNQIPLCTSNTFIFVESCIIDFSLLYNLRLLNDPIFQNTTFSNNGEYSL